MCSLHCCYSVDKSYVRISHKRRGTKFGVYGTKQHKILVWFSLQHQPASRGRSMSQWLRAYKFYLTVQFSWLRLQCLYFSSFWCCRLQSNSISDLTFCCCSLCFVSRVMFFMYRCDCLTWPILDVMSVFSSIMLFINKSTAAFPLTIPIKFNSSPQFFVFVICLPVRLLWFECRVQQVSTTRNFQWAFLTFEKIPDFP